MELLRQIDNRQTDGLTELVSKLLPRLKIVSDTLSYCDLALAVDLSFEAYRSII